MGECHKGEEVLRDKRCSGNGLISLSRKRPAALASEPLASLTRMRQMGLIKTFLSRDQDWEVGVGAQDGEKSSCTPLPDRVNFCLQEHSLEKGPESLHLPGCVRSQEFLRKPFQHLGEVSGEGNLFQDLAELGRGGLVHQWGESQRRTQGSQAQEGVYWPPPRAEFRSCNHRIRAETLKMF